jgi:YHS domain-containing protein
MIRFVLYLLLAVILISLLRSVLGVLGRALSGFLGQGGATQRKAAEPRKAGELKRDPVCGTYVPTTSAETLTIDGQVVHFCSAACREKFRAGQKK